MDSREFLEQVDWETNIYDVVLVSEETEETPAQWRVTVKPKDQNDIGSDIPIEVDFYLIDNMGNQFRVIDKEYEAIAGNILVSDDFRCGWCPQPDLTGLIVKTVGNGAAPHISSAKLDRLDSIAKQNIANREKDILWKYPKDINEKWHPEGLLFTSDPTNNKIINWVAGKIFITLWPENLISDYLVDNVISKNAYHPERIYTVDLGTYTCADDTLHYIYAKLPLLASETTATIVVSKTYLFERYYAGFILVLMGTYTIPDEDGKRSFVMQWNHGGGDGIGAETDPDTITLETQNVIANGKHTHKLEIPDQQVSEVVKSILGNNHESYLIENTANVSETVNSSWTVIPYNEQVGEFKAVVMVRNKALNTIITLMNILSFDYSDAVKVVQQNPMLTDANITLTVGVEAGTSILYATVAGMTTDNKRIHLCFERCVLSERPFDLEASMELTLEMAATITAYLNLSATSELHLDMQAVVSTYHNAATLAEFELAMTALPSFYRNLAASAQFTLNMSAIVDLIESSSPVDFALFYNLPAVNDVRELAPTNWRVAGMADWMNLINFYGGESLAGADLKILETWTAPNVGASADSDFKALPSGQRNQLGEYSGKLTKAIFWIK